MLLLVPVVRLLFVGTQKNDDDDHEQRTTKFHLIRDVEFPSLGDRLGNSQISQEFPIDSWEIPESGLERANLVFGAVLDSLINRQGAIYLAPEELSGPC